MHSRDRMLPENLDLRCLGPRTMTSVCQNYRINILDKYILILDKYLISI